MTAPPRTVDQRITDLFLAGHGLDYVSEQGVVWGWTRARAQQVVTGQGWELDRDGRLAHLNPQPPAPPRPARPPRAPVTRRPVPPQSDRLATPPPDGRRVALSGRQLAVVEELCEHGGTDKQIADALGITHDTVGSHLRSVCKAVSCRTRTELVVEVLTGRVELTRAEYGQAPGR